VGSFTLVKKSKLQSNIFRGCSYVFTVTSNLYVRKQRKEFIFFRYLYIAATLRVMLLIEAGSKTVRDVLQRLIVRL
jgi:hypothetical protein